MVPVVLLLLGLVALTIGAELLVRGAAYLARRFGMAPLLIGLTVVAVGTSTPELSVSILAGLEAKADIAVGNVYGSNIFNILFILGLSALIVPLKIKSQLVRLDVPVMIGATGLAWLLSADAQLTLGECLFLFFLLILYTFFAWYYARKHPEQTDTADSQVQKVLPNSPSFAAAALFIPIGITLLSLGASWFVSGASVIAYRLGIGELAVGLILVAAGTSLPELATSLIAVLRGERDIAVGNVVGSNIFNVFGVLAASGIASGKGLQFSTGIAFLDLPAAFSAAVICLPVFISNAVISRLEGACFLLMYGLYTALVLFRALASPAFFILADLFYYVVLPLVAGFVLLQMWRFYREITITAREISDDINAIVGTVIRNGRKILITVIGITLILAGVAMMVLPGPATVVIPLGLALLSTEYIWAKRLLRYVQKEIEKAAHQLIGNAEPKDPTSPE